MVMNYKKINVKKQYVQITANHVKLQTNVMNVSKVMRLIVMETVLRSNVEQTVNYVKIQTLAQYV